MKFIDRKEVDKVLIDTYTQPIFDMSLSGGGITTAHLYRTLTLEQVEQIKQKASTPVVVSGNTFNGPLEMLTKVYGGETLSSHQFGRVEKFIDEQLNEKRAFINNFSQRVEEFYETHKHQIIPILRKEMTTSQLAKITNDALNDPFKEHIVKVMNKKLETFKKTSLQNFDRFFNGDDVRPFSVFISKNISL